MAKALRKTQGQGARTGQRDRARQIFREATTMAKQKRYEECVAYLKEHADLLERFPLYYEMIGLQLHKMDRMTDSTAYFKRAVAMEPKASRFGYLATNYHIQGDFDKAIDYHKLALKADPKSWQAYYNFAFTLEDMRRYEEALQALEIGRQLNPHSIHILYQIGRYLLALGDIQRGSQMLDAGLGCDRRTVPPGIQGPYWRGEDIKHKRLVVWQEEGLGDEIRNACYYHDLIAKGADLVIECRARLAKIFARSFPDAEIAPQDEPPAPHSRPPFDYHAGQGSLMQFCRPNLADFPTQPGYLKPDPDLVEIWRERLAALGPGPYVGISWTSALVTTQRAAALWPKSVLKDIVARDDLTFVNLMYSATADDVRNLNEELGSNVLFLEDIDLKEDLDNSFALTSALDYVVAAPTSTIDIAGAVGTPGLTMYFTAAPQMLGTNGVPNYPGIRFVTRPARQTWAQVTPQFTRTFEAWLRDFRGSRA